MNFGDFYTKITKEMVDKYMDLMLNENPMYKSVMDRLSKLYRILLTRARYGVYVYFVDADTRKFVESRIEMYMVKNSKI